MVAALKLMGSEPPGSALDVRHRMLMQAAENGDCATIKQLVSQGVPVDAETLSGATALMRAAACGQISAVCELLDLGASINKSRRDGFTPLMLAAFFGYEDLVRELLRRGADIKASSKSGASVIMWAAARGLPSMVQLLRTGDAPLPSSKFRSRLQYAAEEVAEPPQVELKNHEDYLPEEIAELEHIEPSEALTERETATQKEDPQVLYVDESPNDWNLYDGFEGIRRLGPPGAEPRRVSPWEQPLTNVAPFSPFGAVGDRFSRTTKLVSSAALVLVLAGLLVAASWRWWGHTLTSATPGASTTVEAAKPVTSIETQPTGKTESAASLQTSQSAQQPEVPSPQASAPPTTDVVVTQSVEGQHAARPVSRTSRLPRPLYTRQPKSVTDYAPEGQSETERPAAVTVVPKDPTPAKPASRTNDLLTQPVAPVGNANKKRVIQWP